MIFRFLFLTILCIYSPSLFAQGTACSYDNNGNIQGCNGQSYSQFQSEWFTLCRNGGAGAGAGSDAECASAVADEDDLRRRLGMEGRQNGGAASWEKKDGKDAVKGDAANACAEAVKSTAKQCKGAEWAQYAPAVLNLAGAFAAAQSAGNTKKACETAKQIQTISGVSNAGVAAMCQRSISSCKQKCIAANDTVSAENCSKDNETYAKLATGQAIQSAAAMAGSQACADAASGDCIGENAYTNSMCQEFCFKAANANHSKCLSAAANCKNPSFAAQNVQYCTCLANPLSPSCRAGTGTPIPGTNNASLPNLGEDGIGAGEYDFNGSNAEAQAARANSPEGGGGGFGGGGGGSSPFGEGGSGGTGDEPLNKEILTGTGGAAGGGGIFGGGGYAEGVGRGGSGGSSSEEKGLDLSQFLPGGKKDPTRNPASAGYDDPTITKANGLTNWQKVTRKINEKRPELMP